MPKFNVPVTRECTQTTMVDVEAANVEEAVAKAVEEASSEHYNFEWTLDDNSGDSNEPYFAGDDDYESVEEA